MSLIHVMDLTFRYDGSYENIFEHTSFQIDSDWRLGFIGRNGKGKTTFLKLLMGEYEYSGAISTNLEFEYFPYPVKRQDALTLEVLGEICPSAEDWELIRELSLLNVDAEILYRPYETLSSGEKTKAMITAMFLKENAFLLIDEPTNHLDMEGRELLGSYLKKKKGFILVSHDRAFLDSCIDHVLSVNRADIEIQKGNFSTWWENRQRKDQFELAEHTKLKKDIGRLQDAARRAGGWAAKVEKTKKGTKIAGLRPDRGAIGHKSAKMMKRAKSLEKRRQGEIEEKSKLLKNLEESEEIRLDGLTFHADRLVDLKDVTVRYGSQSACENVNFTIRRGEHVALHGKNGSGKSSILKLICGGGGSLGVPEEKEPEDERAKVPANEGRRCDILSYLGSIERHDKLKISYVCQDIANLAGNLSDYAETYAIEESMFKAFLRKLGFSREQFDKRIEDYSDGQKKKVMLARSLCERAHLYVWDEPLNYVDVISRIQIEEMLSGSDATMVFVEHDRRFCERVATKSVFL